MELYIAKSTQMAVDSIETINRQIEVLQKIHIESGISPALDVDIHALFNTVDIWKSTVCPQIVPALKDLLPESRRYKGELDSIGATNQQELLAFAKIMQKGIRVNETTVASVNKALVPLRTSVDKETANLQRDLQGINTELEAERRLVMNMEHQIFRQRRLIDYYNSHPWKLILDGLTIVGLIKDLTDLITAEKEASAALSRLKYLQPKIRQLQSIREPLLCLVTAITGLGAGLSNLQTAAAQVLNILEDIVAQPPLAAIIFAQLETVLDDLKKANAIAAEILGKSG